MQILFVKVVPRDALHKPESKKLEITSLIEIVLSSLLHLVIVYGKMPESHQIHLLLNYYTAGNGNN